MNQTKGEEGQTCALQKSMPRQWFGAHQRIRSGHTWSPAQTYPHLWVSKEGANTCELTSMLFVFEGNGEKRTLTCRTKKNNLGVSARLRKDIVVAHDSDALYNYDVARKQKRSDLWNWVEPEKREMKTNKRVSHSKNTQKAFFGFFDTWNSHHHDLLPPLNRATDGGRFITQTTLEVTESE